MGAVKEDGGSKLPEIGNLSIHTMGLQATHVEYDVLFLHFVFWNQR